MQMPALTAAHRQLERLVGNWRGEERIHPSPFSEGGVAHARVRNVRALDGFAVVQDYEQTRDVPGMPATFRGHGVFRVDAASHQYVMHWFDTFGQTPAEFRGALEGDVLRVTQATDQGQVRATWDLGTPDRYKYTMEVSPDGEHWALFMDGTYVRDT